MGMVSRVALVEQFGLSRILHVRFSESRPLPWQQLIHVNKLKLILSLRMQKADIECAETVVKT